MKIKTCKNLYLFIYYYSFIYLNFIISFVLLCKIILKEYLFLTIYTYKGTSGVIVIVIGNEHGDTSSNTLGKAIFGRLIGVVSLVTAFEEFFYVTCLFWSCDKMNQGTCLFNEQGLRKADVVICSLAPSTWSPPPFFTFQTWKN